MVPALTTLCLILCAVAGVAITTALTSCYSAARLRADLRSANAKTESQRLRIRQLDQSQKEQAHLAWVRQQTIARLKSDVIDALQVGGTNQCESVAPNPPPA